jgi:transcriptional regulator with XRE-family HTH domain
MYFHSDSSVEAQSDKLFQIAQRISQLLQYKQINKSTFADWMGVQPSIVTKWLSGFHNFTIETLLDIEKTLDAEIFQISIPSTQTIISFELKVKPHRKQQLHFDSLPFRLIGSAQKKFKSVQIYYEKMQISYTL